MLILNKIEDLKKRFITNSLEMQLMVAFIALFNAIFTVILVICDITIISTNVFFHRCIVLCLTMILIFYIRFDKNTTAVNSMWNIVLVLSFFLLPLHYLLQHQLAFGWMINFFLSILLCLTLVNIKNIFVLFIVIMYTLTMFYCISLDNIVQDTVFSTKKEFFAFISSTFTSCGIYITYMYRKIDLNVEINNMRLFSGVVAHRVLTPFAVAITTIQVIKREASEFMKKDTLQLTDELLSIIGNARSEVSMMLNNVQNVDDVHCDEICSLEKILRDVISNYYVAKAAVMEINIHSDIQFLGNRRLMEYVIINLLKNAWQHGGHDVKVTISIDANKMILSDNGCGINREASIFTKFFSTKSGYSLGLGLWFCKAAMEKMGGSITCISDVGMHTTFILYFPRCKINTATQ